jgi:Protein of unknown function (DUF4242)
VWTGACGREPLGAPMPPVEAGVVVQAFLQPRRAIMSQQQPPDAAADRREQRLLVHALLTLTRLLLAQGQNRAADTTCSHAVAVAHRLADGALIASARRLQLEVHQAINHPEVFPMPHYIIERQVGQVSPEQLQAAGTLSNQILASMPEVTWVKSYVSDAEGKIYCEYIAPNPDAVLEHARQAGLPADKIAEVSRQIDPSMFS